MNASLDNTNAVFKGYTHQQLDDAFDAVRQVDDWKAPIMVIVPGESVNLVVAAIQFYTATEPRVELVLNSMKYVVSSEGYRNGPAGDH